MTLRQFEIQNICDFWSSSLRFKAETQISSFQPAPPLSLRGEEGPTATGSYTPPSPRHHPAVPSLSQAVHVSIIPLAHPSVPTILSIPVSGLFGAYLVQTFWLIPGPLSIPALPHTSKTSLCHWGPLLPQCQTHLWSHSASSLPFPLLLLSHQCLLCPEWVPMVHS